MLIPYFFAKFMISLSAFSSSIRLLNHKVFIEAKDVFFLYLFIFLITKIIKLLSLRYRNYKLFGIYNLINNLGLKIKKNKCSFKTKSGKNIKIKFKNRHENISSVFLYFLYTKKTILYAKKGIKKLILRLNLILSKKRNFKIGLLLIILIIYFLFWELSVKGQNTNSCSLTFFSVGDGDAALVNIKNQTIIIDGGPNNMLISKIGNKLNYWDRSIDYIIVSHFHSDHVVGLFELLEFYDISNVIYNPPLNYNLLYEEFDKLVKAKKINYGNSYNINKIILNNLADNNSNNNNLNNINLNNDGLNNDGLNNDGSKIVNLSLLYPKKDIIDKFNENNVSIVAKFDFKQAKVLFTGDIEQRAEELILDKDLDIKADILKVPHHGSKTSSTNMFIKKVKPRFAVISVAKDNKNHPGYKVIENYNKNKVKILQTSKDGDITFELF